MWGCTDTGTHQNICIFKYHKIQYIQKTHISIFDVNCACRNFATINDIQGNKCFYPDSILPRKLSRDSLCHNSTGVPGDITEIIPKAPVTIWQPRVLLNENDIFSNWCIGLWQGYTKQRPYNFRSNYFVIKLCDIGFVEIRGRFLVIANMALSQSTLIR